jgi:uncharacterized protein (DUF1330 family)
MPAYLIISYDIDNPDLYAEYQGGAGAALKIGDECELVALDSESELIEGDSAGHQTVILKFDSVEKAKEIYNSDDYQAVVGKRHDATSNHRAVLVNGLV